MNTITIMQGLPGSGKSYIAHRTLPGLICSADDFPGLYTPADDGPPQFRPEKLGLAHGACFRRALDGVRSATDVIVDNTNTTALEMAPYVAMAQAYGVAPIILRVECDLVTAYNRNTHGVPWHVYMDMAERLEGFEAPPHWRYILGFEMRTIKNEGD